MPLAQRIDPAGMTDICPFLTRWMIHPDLARALYKMAARAPFGISIISGYRTPDQQEALKREGRPAADPSVSTHLSCPAGGADVRLDVAVTDAVKATFGRLAVEAGLRWGGGSPVDQNGIPSDWNHVDLGPRSGYGWQV